MTTSYKDVSGDYTLTCEGGVGIFTINAANTIFNGNLTYTGNLTTVDDFIVVGANNTGAVWAMVSSLQACEDARKWYRWQVVDWTQSPAVATGAGWGRYAKSRLPERRL